jgi:hypothetical protein
MSKYLTIKWREHETHFVFSMHREPRGGIDGMGRSEGEKSNQGKGQASRACRIGKRRSPRGYSFCTEENFAKFFCCPISSASHRVDAAGPLQIGRSRNHSA